MVELVDTTDLKSVGPHAVPVRVRVAAPLWITARSSAGQSNGLLSRGSEVRVLSGVPSNRAKRRNHVRKYVGEE